MERHGGARVRSVARHALSSRGAQSIVERSRFRAGPGWTQFDPSGSLLEGDAARSIFDSHCGNERGATPWSARSVESQCGCVN